MSARHQQCLAENVYRCSHPKRQTVLSVSPSLGQGVTLGLFMLSKLLASQPGSGVWCSFQLLLIGLIVMSL